MESKYTSTTGTIINNTSYEYDANDNITKETNTAVTGSTTNNSSVNSSNLTFDSKNRLNSADGTTYTYDALDTRISATNTTGTALKFVTNTNTSLSQVLMQNDTAGNTTGSALKFVTDPNTSLSQVLMQNDTAGNTTYYVYGLGLISQETSTLYLNYHYD